MGKEIRYCCTEPDILKYWQDRYGWTALQATLIDNVGTKAVAHKLSKGTTRRIQKLRCGWLPVNHREARHDPDQPPGCVACSPTGLIDETVDHIFQCQSQARKSAAAEHFTRFKANLRELKTAHCIIDALQAGATAWLKGDEIPSVESLTFPDSDIGTMTKQAFIDQTSLGWNVLFRGFCANSWRLAQEIQFRSNRSQERQDTGERWAGKVQLWFINFFESMWGLRNEGQHGLDAETQRLVRSTKCERAIRRLYAIGLELPQYEQHPFRCGIDDLLQKAVADQELWILQTERYLPKCLRRIRRRGENRQLPITLFFARRQ